MPALRIIARSLPRTAAPIRSFSNTPAAFLQKHATNKGETPENHSAGTDTQGDVATAGKQAAENGNATGLDTAAQSKGGKGTGEGHKDTPSAGVGMKDQVGGSGNQGASHVGPKE